MLSGGALGALGECARVSVSGSASGSASGKCYGERKGKWAWVGMARGRALARGDVRVLDVRKYTVGCHVLPKCGNLSVFLPDTFD